MSKRRERNIDESETNWQIVKREMIMILYDDSNDSKKYEKKKYGMTISI